MKKVIFVLSFASLGGVEKSLLNLLHNFDFGRYSVDIALFSKDGELLNNIPKEVNIIKVDSFNGENWNLINDSPWDNLELLLKSHRYLSVLIFCFFYFINKKTKNKFRINYLKWLTRKTKNLPTHYDIAIAYEGPNELIDFFVWHKINARKKIGWIHFDVDKFGCSTISKKIHRFYDKICVVSDSARLNFVNKYPYLEQKTLTFYNRILVDNILEKANEGNLFINDTSIKLLTVGRISQEKGQTLAIQALKLLLDKGYNIHWYFVGDGNNRIYCENLAKDLEIYNYTFFVGNKINPYPYMKHCDIYVQPSFHEGFCITLSEALCFDNPIVTTDFTGAREQLKNRPNCIITTTEPTSLVIAIENALKLPKYPNPKCSNSSGDDLYKLFEE